MNLQMEGASYEGFFVIADIRVDLPLPTERLAYFDPDWNPGNTILMHRATPRHSAVQRFSRPKFKPLCAICKAE